MVYPYDHRCGWGPEADMQTPSPTTLYLVSEAGPHRTWASPFHKHWLAGDAPGYAVSSLLHGLPWPTLRCMLESELRSQAYEEGFVW